MDFCAARTISNLAHHHHGGSGSEHLFSTAQPHLRWEPSSPLKPTSISLSKQGMQSYKYSSLRSTTSDDKSSGTSQYVKDGTHGVITCEDRFASEEEEYSETVQEEAPQEGSPLDVQKRISEFFDQLNAKITNVFLNLPFDPENSYPFFIYGGAATAALYLATAIVSSIDSIPVFPKLMEVVGLGYTLWFSTRYLIFKRNRDELAAKIEEFKQKVTGSDDN